MKTLIKSPSRTQQIFNFFLAFGLITLLLAPVNNVQAQTGEPSAPLAPQLTWMDLGYTERAFTINDEFVTLSGVSYQAKEAFDLESSDDIAVYYSTTSLAELGWQEVSRIPDTNGTTSVYFHSAGVYAVVEFVGCEGDPALTCLTVWQSNPSDIVPTEEERFAPQVVGTVNKTSPSNDATNVDTTVTLSWGAYTGTDLDRYRYCIDTTNNSDCDDAGNWTNAANNRSVTVSGLTAGTTYYWQVQVVTDDNTRIEANSGDWWSFRTRVSTTTPPGAFAKSLPAAGATGQSITPTLVWQASSGVASYEYCVDITNNGLCDSNWVSTTSTFVTLMTGLGPNLTYYWQVRAVNTVGLTYANGSAGSWASFVTAPGPANDTVDTAADISALVPYENTPNTTSATLDSGTANTCSSAPGFSSVWYKYAATANSRIYLDTFGTSYDTFIAVWTKNANGTLSLVTCSDNAAGVLQSSVNLGVVNGTTYYIQVAQKSSSSVPPATTGGTLQFHRTTFADVLANNPFWKSIEGIYGAGISSGCATSPNLLYCPSSTVDRASMAVFLLKGAHGSSYSPPAVGASTGFTDVPVTYWAAAWIKQLAAEGITSGCGSGNYCPTTPVTRAQMAIFLLRSKHGSSYVPPAVGASTGFNDVPTTYWAAAWIKQLAAEGITSGCGTNIYCPESGVTRDQMAVFLSRTFSIPPRP
jgi:hypothetical protein